MLCRKILSFNHAFPIALIASENIVNEKAQLLFVNTGGYRVALVVDEIKGKFDVVMKNLGPHLRSVRGIAGGTVMGNGRVVLVLELLELLSTQNKALARTAGLSMNTALREGFVVPASHVTPRPTTVTRESQSRQNQQSQSATGSATEPAAAQCIRRCHNRP